MLQIVILLTVKGFTMSKTMKVIGLSVLTVGAKHCMEPIICELLYLVLIQPI